jgi:uncharacterized protein YkwD
MREYAIAGTVRLRRTRLAPIALRMMIRFVRLAILLLVCIQAFALAGCLSLSGSAAEVSDAPVSASATQSMINSYRASHGLPPVTHDPRLDKVAADMARLIGRNDSMATRAHSARGLSGRLDRAGYPTFAGAENLGAGYVSLEHAMSGWKGSPDHNRNLLNPYVTRFGIARTQRPDGRYRNFWVLILARPVADGRPDV